MKLSSRIRQKNYWRQRILFQRRKQKNTSPIILFIVLIVLIVLLFGCSDVIFQLKEKEKKSWKTERPSVIITNTNQDLPVKIA